MGYVGNQTTNSYSSMDKQVITGNGGASYTLTHAVANAQEIEVFVNNVRQEAGVAYTVNGTALSMTGNVASTDDFYVIYQGKALQTVVPPDGSVTSAKLASGAAASNLGTSVNLATIKDSTGTNTAMTIDSSGVITAPAKPAFVATSSGGVHTTNSSSVLDFDTTRINRGNHYNTSTYTFTAPVAGIYNFYWHVYQQNGTNGKSIALQKNGSDYVIYDTAIAYFGTVNIQDHTMNASLMMDLAVNDTIRIAVRNGSPNLQWYGGHSWFQGYLIG